MSNSYSVRLCANFNRNEHWTYPDTDAPLLWAEGIRRYILNGTCIAEATGGGFYTKPTIKIYTEGLNLEPIDVDALWKENERLMLGLEKTSIISGCRWRGYFTPAGFDWNLHFYRLCM